MPKVLGVTKAITYLNEAHNTLQLSPTYDTAFFPEWTAPFPELTLPEIEVCDRWRTRYQYYQAQGDISLDSSS
ncbi:MAG: hypothetical protein AAFY20_18245 [Cyanobacteria bacterium J06639_14]